MSKKGKEWNIFIWILAYLTMTVLSLVIAALITFFVLLAADIYYFEPPSWVAPKQKWWFRRQDFWQRVNWIFAGVVFGIVFIGYWVGIFGKDFKKWLGTKDVK